MKEITKKGRAATCYCGLLCKVHLLHVTDGRRPLGEGAHPYGAVGIETVSFGGESYGQSVH
jgi:hypothetical protein